MVNELYYLQPCPTCGGFHNQAETTIHFSPKIIEAYLRKLYGKKFDVETEIEPTIWREVLKYLNQACAEGISQSSLPPTLEQDFYSELKLSNGVFAAFKVHSMGNIMAEKLMDENGKLKPFRIWKEEVASIASHFVGPWLQTEYNTAVIRAHNAADWLNFERNKDIFPNLRWMPTTSPNPEESHRLFWERKVTRPINDPFWNKHRPGDRWNCKCTLEATDDPITDIPGETNKERPQPGLKENPAKTKQIFDKSHPYFPKSCDKCKFNKGIKNKFIGWYKNIENDCYHCTNATIVKKGTDLQKKLASYKDDVWDKTYISTNGFVVTNKERINEANVNKQEKEKFDKELRMCKVLADNGHFVEFLQGVNRPKGQTYDIRIDGIKADLKCITGGAGNIVKYTKKALEKQGGEAVVLEIPSHTNEYYEKLAEARRKCKGRIFFYFSEEQVLKEIKK